MELKLDKYVIERLDDDMLLSTVNWRKRVANKKGHVFLTLNFSGNTSTIQMTKLIDRLYHRPEGKYTYKDGDCMNLTSDNLQVKPTLTIKKVKAATGITLLINSKCIATFLTEAEVNIAIIAAQNTRT